MKKYVLLSIVPVVMLLLASCGKQTQEIPTPSLTPSLAPTQALQEVPAESALPPASLNEIVDITWQWATQFVRTPASQSVVPLPQDYTLLFRLDGTFSIHADCNSGSGSFSVDGTSIILKLGPVTLAECGPESLGNDFLSLLEDVNRFGIQDEVLVLVSQDGNTLNSFTNGGSAGPVGISPEELSIMTQEAFLDIDWQMIAVYETTPASQMLLPDPQNYSIVFREDSSVEIKADCNLALGAYEINDGQMSITLGPTTLAECESGSLSSTFLEWLQGVTDFRRRERDLVLISGDGVTFLEFQNAGLVPLEPDTCAWIDMRSVTIDTHDLPEAAQTFCIPGTPYEDTQPPGPSGLPQHVQITFGTDLLPEDVQFNDPILYIIPIGEYEQLWSTSGNPAITDAIEALSTLLSDQSDNIPVSGMPILPAERLTGLNDLSVQGEFLEIQMGYGVRFVGRIAENPAPVTNDDPQLFYTFLGLSADGRYLISFFYPVSVDVLPGVDLVSDEERLLVENNYQAYLADKVEELNTLEPSAWMPDLTLLDAVITSLNFEYTVPVDEPGLTNNLWMWNGLVVTEPASQSVIAEPQNYTLVFLPDGSLSIVADCNSASGSYTLAEDALSIRVGLMTRTTCDRRSLSEQFITLLTQASAYRFDQNQLVISLQENAGSMLFIFGGPVISIPPVPEDTPRIISQEVINVRSGPGVEYPTYGVVPAGVHAEVVGVSEGGEWWVVKIPADFASDEQGWISAEFVEAFDTEGVPIIPVPEVGEVELIAPQEGSPTATILEPVNVRSGPGVQYPSYGIAPFDARAEIIGISPDGLWWVVKIPTTLNPEEQGWISAAYVTATNVEDVPVIAPPLP